jgi:Ca2+-binding RTX toxin-like protein
MILRKAVRMVVNRKAVALAAVIFGVTAATALAATFNGTNGNDFIVGTPHVADTINSLNGNDTIYGQGGGDTINVGRGDDQVDADGMCSGVKPGVYSHLPAGAYCAHVQFPGEPRSTINVGGGQGDDTIFGGGGRNSINANNPGGNDTIYGGPIGDTINTASTGESDNQIYLGGGSQYTGSTVNDGNGDSVIHAQNGVADTINCARGNGTTVYADAHKDVVNGCHRVITTPDPNPGPMPRPVTDRQAGKQAKAGALQAGAAGQALSGALRLSR